MGSAGAIVGDVEKVTNLIVQHDLAFFLGDVFADHNHAIGLPTSVRSIVELGDFFTLQTQGFEAAFADDLVLDVDGPVTQACHGLIACRPGQLFPGLGRQLLGQSLQVVPGVVAENEGYPAISMPAVEMLGLREVGVAAQQDLVEAAAQTGGGGAVEASAAPSCDGRLPLRLTRRRTSRVLANEMIRGW